MMKPQDILVGLKLALAGDRPRYVDLASDLGLSVSEAHACVRRLGEAALLDPETQEVRRTTLVNVIIHGLPHAFPVRLRELTRGMPTAWAAPVLSPSFSTQDGQPPPVWPDPHGSTQGMALTPLYGSVPQAARRDSQLYDLLALVDAMRIGRARERQHAERLLRQRLLPHAPR